MISLFERSPRGDFLPFGGAENAVFSSLDTFQNAIGKAEDGHAYDQLVIMGSKGDIAWVHASLPHAAVRHIVAEIEYPLLPAWFKKPLSGLTHAIEGVFHA